MPPISVLVANLLLAAGFACWWWTLDDFLIEQRRARARGETWKEHPFRAVGYPLLLTIWLVVIVLAFLGVMYHH